MDAPLGYAGSDKVKYLGRVTHHVRRHDPTTGQLPQSSLRLDAQIEVRGVVPAHLG